MKFHQVICSIIVSEALCSTSEAQAGGVRLDMESTILDKAIEFAAQVHAG